MRLKRLILILHMLPIGIAAQVDSVRHDAVEWDSLPKLTLYNPVLSGGASLLVPGAGQLYTKRYFKSALFLSSEAVTLSSYFFWREEMKVREKNASVLSDSLVIVTDTLARKDLVQRSALRRFDARGAELTSINVLTWAGGMYLFNVLDGISSSNRFVDFSEKSPAIAGWLSVVPGLGLGHLYNGSIGKTGMVMMGQTALGVMAYNHHQLIQSAEDSYKRLTADSSAAITTAYSDDWQYRRNNAFRSRNAYLWYSVFFYLYSIFDAVVDAHLHDYPVKMQIDPDLNAKNPGLTMGIHIDF